MELRRDALFGTISLILLVGLMAFGTIGLLGRMKPAIHVILDENVGSLSAAERMLGVLSRASGEPLSEHAAGRYERALEALTANVTEENEAPLVARLIELKPRVLAGDRWGTEQSVRSLEELLALNLAAMREADRGAQQLSVAGAWAVVFLALLAVLIGYVALRSLDRRLLFPVVELRRVLESASNGEVHRRLLRHTGSKEFDIIFKGVNELLDRQVEALGVIEDPEMKLVRGALAHLLDARPTPAFVVEASGDVLASNELGLAALADDAEGAALRKALREAPLSVEESQLSVPSWLQVERIEGYSLYLCSLTREP